MSRSTRSVNLTPFQPPNPLRQHVHRGPLFTRPPPFFTLFSDVLWHVLGSSRNFACLQRPRHRVLQVENVSFFSTKPAPRFRRIFRGLATITTTGAFRIHVFSAAVAEKEVLSGHERIFQILLSSHSVFPVVSLWVLFPLLLSFLPLLPSLLSSGLPSISYIFSPCSVKSHAVLCEVSNQHQQQDRADPVSSCSKATQQREIDGLCSRTSSASPHIVCLWARVFVICRMEWGM